MSSKKSAWWYLALQMKGSVIPAIYQRILFVAAFGFLISILWESGYAVSQPLFANIIPSVVLGLLLVFRTNTAYERYWEGRKLWGTIVNDTRNLALQIWTLIEEIEPEDRVKKIAALRLVAAFPVACKLHLRAEPVNQELAKLMSRSEYAELSKINHPPLEIALWIGK